MIRITLTLTQDGMSSTIKFCFVSHNKTLVVVHNFQLFHKQTNCMLGEPTAT